MYPGIATNPDLKKSPEIVHRHHWPDEEALHVGIVDEELPYPLNSGKRIRTVNLIRRLAKRHHITYIAYRFPDPEETRNAEDFLRGCDMEVVLVDRILPLKSGLRFYAHFC